MNKRVACNKFLLACNKLAMAGQRLDFTRSTGGMWLENAPREALQSIHLPISIFVSFNLAGVRLISTIFSPMEANCWIKHEIPT